MIKVLLLLSLAVFFATSLVNILSADRLTREITERVNVRCPSCESTGTVEGTTSATFRQVAISTTIQLIVVFILAGCVLFV
jgi:hypothetical protein